jgi:hypothetical protein
MLVAIGAAGAADFKVAGSGRVAGVGMAATVVDGRDAGLVTAA